MPIGREGALVRRAIGFRARGFERARRVMLVARLDAVEVGGALEVAFRIEGRARVLAATGLARRTRVGVPALPGDYVRRVGHAVAERINYRARPVGVVAERITVHGTDVHRARDAVEVAI